VTEFVRAGQCVVISAQYRSHEYGPFLPRQAFRRVPLRQQ
jgi:hypothetical protein